MLNNQMPLCYRILTASRMWQSEFWTQNTTNVLSHEERFGNAALPSAKRIAWRLAWNQRRSNVVCTSGEVNLWFCFFCHLVPWKRRPHVMGELFLPEPEPKRILWNIKRWIRRLLFRRVNAFLLYSDSERQLWADYLKLPLSRFHKLLFHTNVLQPRMTPEGKYGFAAGKSERDYATFFNAIQEIKFPFVVVADETSVANLRIPDNVTLYCSISYEEYLRLLEKACFTIVPLHFRNRSAGQVVLLEGYALGKPVVATRMIGTEDYLIEGKTGFFVKPYDVKHMREKIVEIIDSPEREKMGKNALALVLKEHTFERFVERELEVVESILSDIW